MPLKRQLLLISLIFLAIPWAGCQIVREVESTLRQGQEQNLSASASAIAAVLQADHSVLELLRRDEQVAQEGAQDSPPRAGSLNFQFAPLPVVVDGYADEEWESATPAKIAAAEDPEQWLQYQTMIRDGRLYLYFDIHDQDINYYKPSSPLASDQLILLLAGNDDSENPKASQRYSIATSTPGRVNVRRLDQGLPVAVEPSINAHWQDRIGGYHIEVSIPLTLSQGRIGFYRHDTDAQRGLLSYGSVSADTELAPRAIYSTDSLTERLELFAQSGQKLGLVDRNGRRLAEVGSLYHSGEDDSYWALRRLYSAILELPSQQYKADQSAGEKHTVQTALNNLANSQWYRGQAYSTRSVLSSAAPLVSEAGVIGAVYLEHNSEQFLALTDHAFSRIFLLSFAVLLLGALALLAFASLLSLRIRRLSQAAQRVIAEDGSVQTDFPQSRSRDEIGDLTRNYGAMVRRVREYTEYLQSLSRKLSHELRTPLAIVQTSLDNLEREELSDSGASYVSRAKDGAQQLSRILSAMSEATRVEESIAASEMEDCDLVSLLTDISKAYNDLYRQHSIVFDNSSGQASLTLQLAPELVVQMLDKLVENAADYAPARSTINIGCTLRDSQAVISVSNEGDTLSETLRSQLFQKMVSLRSQQDQGMHLGLGLHIVKLIAEHHQGSVKAYNLVNDIGVCFEVALPYSPAASRST